MALMARGLDFAVYPQRRPAKPVHLRKRLFRFDDGCGPCAHTEDFALASLTPGKDSMATIVVILK